MEENTPINTESQAPIQSSSPISDNDKELKATINAQELRIHELENYKQEITRNEERETLYKELMLSDHDKEVVTNLISKHRVKDQSAFIKDFYQSVVKPRDNISKKDQLYNLYETSNPTKKHNYDGIVDYIWNKK